MAIDLEQQLRERDQQIAELEQKIGVPARRNRPAISGSSSTAARTCI